jgi:hypothetical protein
LYHHQHIRYIIYRHLHFQFIVIYSTAYLLLSFFHHNYIPCLPLFNNAT